MIEERFESYVYQIMKYVKYQENKPYIESILEEMRYTLFREDREYIKVLENKIDKAIEYITSYESADTLMSYENKENNKDLDEKTMIEMGRRYLIIQGKLLEILGDKK